MHWKNESKIMEIDTGLPKNLNQEVHVAIQSKEIKSKSLIGFVRRLGHYFYICSTLNPKSFNFDKITNDKDLNDI